MEMLRRKVVERVLRDNAATATRSDLPFHIDRFLYKQIFLHEHFSNTNKLSYFIAQDYLKYQ